MCSSRRNAQIRGAPWLILEAGGWITKVEGLMTQSGGWRLDYKSFCQISFYISNSKKKSSEKKKFFFSEKDWEKIVLAKKKSLGQKTDKLKFGFDIILCFPFCVCLCMCTCVSRLSIKLFLPAIFTGHLKGHPLDQSSIYACLRSLCATGCLPPVPLLV